MPHHLHHAPIEQIDDHEFLLQFENQTLDPAHFNHIGHLRLAWLYLNTHDVETAVNLVCTGIQMYANSLGATTKFHLTITDSLVRIMAKRMRISTQTEHWRPFLHDNLDLVNDAVAVLTQYFSRDLLFSDAARTLLITPDIRPI